MIIKYNDFLEFKQNLKVDSILESKQNLYNLDAIGNEFVNLLKNDSSFIIDKSGKVIKILNWSEIVDQITNDGINYDPELADSFFGSSGSTYDDVIEGDDGQFYKLSDLRSIKIPGLKNRSTGGGPGALSTEEVESLQCLILSYRQDIGRTINMEDYDLIKEDIESEDFNISNYKNIDVRIDINIDVFEKFPDWRETFLLTANFLYERKTKISRGVKSDFILNSNIQYKFCHNKSNGISKCIVEKFRKLIKNITNERIDVNKWNPSDIWAVSVEEENRIIMEVNNCKSISSLTRVIDKNFDSRKLIGISLKKVGKSVNFIINKITDPPTYSFLKIKLSSDPIINTGLSIIANRESHSFGQGIEEITFRNFNLSNKVASDITGEVIGKEARGGKISLRIINLILEENNIEPIPSAEELSLMSDEELIFEISNLDRYIKSDPAYFQVTKTVRQKEPDSHRLISKYQSLILSKTIFDNIENKTEEYRWINGIKNRLSVSDIIIQDILLHALSIRLKYKKGEESLRTPKYVRVVE